MAVTSGFGFGFVGPVGHFWYVLYSVAHFIEQCYLFISVLSLIHDNHIIP